MAGLLLVGACSSRIPPEIRNPLPDEETFARVLADPQTYLSKRFRWGGVIVETENGSAGSRMQVVAFPLDDLGRPITGRQSPGRFIAATVRFLEPMVYRPDRQVTVTGELVSAEMIKIGEFDYRHPVLEIDQLHLWPIPVETIEEPPLYYRPYYPYYPWPVIPHRHYHR